MLHLAKCHQHSFPLSWKEKQLWYNSVMHSTSCSLKKVLRMKASVQRSEINAKILSPPNQKHNSHSTSTINAYSYLFMLGWQLDSMILEVFFNLNDFLTLYMYVCQCVVYIVHTHHCSHEVFHVLLLCCFKPKRLRIDIFFHVILTFLDS